jgi:hypothetical protein
VLQYRAVKITKVITILLALLALLQLGRAFTALFSPVVIDYCEMMVGGAIAQLQASHDLSAIYAPPAAPYGMPGVQYPPLFIWLGAILPGLPTVLAERLLAWSLYVGAGALVGLNVWQETHQKWAALVAAIIPFCFWSVIIFVHTARVDPLALFLSLLAAYIYRRQTRAGSPSLPELALVALLCALAFFSKQTYLAVSAAIFFDLGLKGWRNPKSSIQSALSFSLLWLGWVGLGFGLFGWLSGGEFFGIYDAARAGSFILQLVPGFVGFFVLDHLPLLILAGIALRRQWQQGEYFWPLYSLFAALACVTIIKDGAVDYYFNELAYTLAVAVGLQLATVLAGDSHKQKAPGFKLNGTTVLLGVQTLVALGMFLGWSHWKDYDNNRRAYEEGLALVRTTQAEDASSSRPSLILVNSFLLETDRADQIGDYFIYSVLLKNGKRDMRPLVSDLEAERYRLIMTEEFNRWPPEVEAAFANHYNKRIIVGEAGRKIYWIFTPRSNG